MFSALHLLSYLIVALCVSFMLFFRPEEVANPSLPPPPDGLYYFRSNETWKVLDYDRVETLRHRLLLGYMMSSDNNISAPTNDYHHLLSSSVTSSSSAPVITSSSSSSPSSQDTEVMTNNSLATKLSPSANVHTMEPSTLMSSLDEKSLQHINFDFASFAEILAKGNHSMESAVKRPVERVEVEKIIVSQLLHMLSLSEHQYHKNFDINNNNISNNSSNTYEQTEHEKIKEALRSITELPLPVHVIAAAHGSPIIADDIDNKHHDKSKSSTFSVNNSSIPADRIAEMSFNDLTFIHAAMLHKTSLIIPNCESVTFGYLIKYERDSITQVLRTDKPKYIPIVTVSTGNLMNSASVCLASLIEHSFHNLDKTTMTMSKRARGTAKGNHNVFFKVQSITFIGTAQVSPVVGAGGWHVQARSRDKVNEYLLNIHEKEKFEQMLKAGTLHSSTNDHNSLQNSNRFIRKDNKTKTKCNTKETNLQSEDVDLFINPACQHEMFFAQNAMLMSEHQYEHHNSEHILQHDERHLYSNREEVWKRQEKEAEMIRQHEKQREVQASKKVALGSVCVTDMAIMGECGFCSEDTPVTSLCSRPRCGSHNSTTFFGKCIFSNELGSKSASHRMAARMKGAILRSTLPPIPFLVKEGMREYWANFEALEEYVSVITHPQLEHESYHNEQNKIMHYLQYYLPDMIVKKVLENFWHIDNNTINYSNTINSSNYAINENSDYTNTSKNNTSIKEEVMFEYNRAAPSNATVLNCAEVSSHELKYSIREDALCREYVAEVYNLSSLSLQKEMNMEQKHQLVSPRSQEQFHTNGLISSDDVSCVRGREGVSLLHLAHQINKQVINNNIELGSDHSRQMYNKMNSLAQEEELQTHQPESTWPTESIPVVIVRGTSSYTTLPLTKRQYKKEILQMKTRECVLHELRHYNESASTATNSKGANKEENNNTIIDDEFVQWSQLSLSRLEGVSHGRSNHEAKVEEENEESITHYTLTPEFINAAYQYAIETASAAVLNYFFNDNFDEQINV